MSDLTSAVCAITPTHRRRFFWAAWWSRAPQHAPFVKPDASNGGARTLEEALAEAERVSGRHLTLIEPYWARAWNRVLRGEPAPPLPEARAPRVHASPQPVSAWATLGVEPGASIDDVKRAFRKRALETHPDVGGDSDVFRAVRSAYERLVERAK